MPSLSILAPAVLVLAAGPAPAAEVPVFEAVLVKTDTVLAALKARPEGDLIPTGIAREDCEFVAVSRKSGIPGLARPAAAQGYRLEIGRDLRSFSIQVRPDGEIYESLAEGELLPVDARLEPLPEGTFPRHRPGAQFCYANRDWRKAEYTFLLIRFEPKK